MSDKKRYKYLLDHFYFYNLIWDTSVLDEPFFVEFI